MPLFAANTASTTALDRLKEIPPDFWLKLCVALVALVLLVFLLRKVAHMNKIVVAVVTIILVTTVGFNWIYERNEPAWATPAVNFLSGYFPSKGVAAKHAAALPGQ
jgi:apolipoprotein N-acyltransferase